MTLIAGTRTWKGICLAADTRVTKKSVSGTVTFEDNCQKCELAGGGLALAVAGDCQTARLFEQVLRKNYKSCYQDTLQRKISGEIISLEPEDVLIDVIKNSLIEVSSLPEVLNRPAKETIIGGLIALIDTPSLKLNQQECVNILKCLEYTSTAHLIIQKYLLEIIACANGEKKNVEVNEFSQNVLISFTNILGSAYTQATLEVNSVPFGEIMVLGSGVSTDHKEEQFKTLAYLLIETQPENLPDSAFHLTRTHGWSEQTVLADPRYGFQTFGGASLPMIIFADPKNPGNVELSVLTGKIYRKSDGKLISEIYENSDHKLCARGEDSKEHILIPFSSYNMQKLQSLKLEIHLD